MTTQKSITSQQLIAKKLELADDGSRMVYYNKGRKHLLITVGDSWTYGDSLGGPHPYRPSAECNTALVGMWQMHCWLIGLNVPQEVVTTTTY